MLDLMYEIPNKEEVAEIIITPESIYESDKAKIVLKSKKESA